MAWENDMFSDNYQQTPIQQQIMIDRINRTFTKKKKDEAKPVENADPYSTREAPTTYDPNKGGSPTVLRVEGNKGSALPGINENAALNHGPNVYNPMPRLLGGVFANRAFTSRSWRGKRKRRKIYME